MTRRTDRINGVLRQEISSIMSREMGDPRMVGVVSITRVETSADLHYAKVYLSVLGGQEEKQAVLRAVESATGFIRNGIRPRLTLKHIPELRFILDESIAKAEYIIDIMNQFDGDVPVSQPVDPRQRLKKVSGY